jgi:hypothetical protein
MFHRALVSVTMTAAAALTLVGCAGEGQDGSDVGESNSAIDSPAGALLEPNEFAASACTAVGVSRNQGDAVFYDGLAIASDRAETATAADPQWFPLAQSLTNLTAVPRPTPSASQEELDTHYRAYLQVVIACLPAGVVLPTE